MKRLAPGFQILGNPATHDSDVRCPSAALGYAATIDRGRSGTCLVHLTKQLAASPPTRRWIPISSGPECTSMSETDPARLYDAAIALRKSENPDDFINALNHILTLHPNHVQTHMALAVFQQKQGRFEEAIHHARRVAEIEPNDAFSFTQLSVIYQRCGKILEAEDAMAKARAIQGNPGHKH